LTAKGVPDPSFIKENWKRSVLCETTLEGGKQRVATIMPDSNSFSRSMVELKAQAKSLEVFEQLSLDGRSNVKNMPNKKILKGMNFEKKLFHPSLPEIHATFKLQKKTK